MDIDPTVCRCKIVTQGMCGYKCVNSVLNVEILVEAFNQETTLVGAFSVIVKSSRIFG